jgi:hypothetical protein
MSEEFPSRGKIRKRNSRSEEAGILDPKKRNPRSEEAGNLKPREQEYSTRQDVKRGFPQVPPCPGETIDILRLSGLQGFWHVYRGAITIDFMSLLVL